MSDFTVDFINHLIIYSVADGPIYVALVKNEHIGKVLDTFKATCKLAAEGSPGTHYHIYVTTVDDESTQIMVASMHTIYVANAMGKSPFEYIDDPTVVVMASLIMGGHMYEEMIPIPECDKISAG